jgi:hypothetical protein
LEEELKIFATAIAVLPLIFGAVSANAQAWPEKVARPIPLPA